MELLNSIHAQPTIPTMKIEYAIVGWGVTPRSTRAVAIKSTRAAANLRRRDQPPEIVLQPIARHDRLGVREAMRREARQEIVERNGHEPDVLVLGGDTAALADTRTIRHERAE